MGSSRTLRGGTSPAGELQSSSHNANLIAPYASEKIAYGLQITCTVRTVYENLKYKRYHVSICLDLPYRCVQVQTVQVVRTSSVKNALFTGRGGQAARCPQSPAPCGHREGRCYVLHQSTPKWELWCFFALCLNIRKILQKGRKSGRTATEKEKSPYWLQICNSKGRGETVY